MLAPCPSRLACRCAALSAWLQFKLGKAGEHTSHHAPRCGRTVDAVAATATHWEAWLDAAEVLTPQQRGAVRSVITDSVLEGWAPSLRAVELLVQFAAGTITYAEYRAIVVREAAASR